MATRVSPIDSADFRRAFAAMSGYACALAAAQFLAVAFSLAPWGVHRGGAWTIVAASLSVGVFVWHWVAPKRARKKARAASAAAPRRFLAFRILAALGMAVYAGQWAVVALMSDWSTDGNMYHIPTIHLWAMSGRIRWIGENFSNLTHALMNGFPKGVETIGFLMATGAQSNRWIDGANLMFLPLGVLAIRTMSLGLGAAPRIAWGAGWLFVLVPIVVCQTPTTYVDASFAACAAGLFAAFFTAQRMALERHFAWELLPALASTAGLTIAAKSNGLLVAAAAIALLAASMLWTVLAWDGPEAGRFAFVQRVLAVLYFAAGGALIAGGYWLVRNYKVMGNPLYPFEVALGGRVLFEGESVARFLDAAANTDPIFQRRPAAYRIAFSWLQGGPLWPATAIGYDTQRGGWGFIWGLGCLPAIAGAVVLSCARSVEWRRLAFLLSATALVVVSALGNPLYWHARFLLIAFALGLPCFARAATRIYAYDLKPWRRLGKAWVWTCLGIASLEGAMAFAWMGSYAYPGGWRALRESPSNILKAASWRRPSFQSFPEAENTLLAIALQSADGVAMGPSGTEAPRTPRMGKMVGELCGAFGRIVVPAPTLVGEREVRMMHDRGIRFVLWDDTYAIPGALLTGSKAADQVAGYYVFELRD